MRMIFVNLPIKDVKASRAFFEALGFSINEEYSDENTACVIIEENIYAMLLAEPRFREFINGEIADAHTTKEVLNALSCASREEADGMLAAALKAGGKAWKPAIDLGFMYGVTFQDLDGHVWEFAYMAPQPDQGM